MNEPAHRVVWAEGMLVSPQHLQQQDHYHEMRTNALLRAVYPQTFGVVRLRFDVAALQAGSVAVAQFEGVLPGGLHVAFSGGDPIAPPPRVVAEHLSPTQQTMAVYLGVPRQREGIPSVYGAGSDHAPSARYRGVTRSVVESSGADGRTAQVTYAEPNLSLLFDSEANSDFDSLQLGELTRLANGALSWSHDYIPPCLQVQGSAFLTERLRALLASLCAKRRELMETTGQRDAANTEFRSADLTTYLQLASINGAVPALQHLTDSPELSPHWAFTVLSQLAGQLGTFDPDADPTSLPKLRHTDLRSTFGPLMQHIEANLNTNIVGRCLKMPCVRQDGGMLVARFADDAIGDCGQVILAVAVQPPLQPDEVAVVLPRIAKLSPEGDMPQLLRSAIQGIPLNVTHRPPSEIAVRPNVVYFMLDTTAPIWKDAVQQRNLALFLPEHYSGSAASYELLAVPRS